MRAWHVIFLGVGAAFFTDLINSLLKNVLKVSL